MHFAMSTVKREYEFYSFSSRYDLLVHAFHSCPSSQRSEKKKYHRGLKKDVPGRIRASVFTELRLPQRDDLTTNRQGPKVTAALALRDWSRG